MTKKKIKYVITYNTVAKNCKKYMYTYGSTKGIQIAIAKKGVSITVYQTVVQDKIEIITHKKALFSNAIKKAVLLYLLHNSKSLVVKTITVQIDDESETIAIEQYPESRVYSLIEGTLKVPLSRVWQEKSIVDRILPVTKPTADTLVPALFAYLCSKSKQYEAEKLLYQWMAFNGMYLYLLKSCGCGKNDDTSGIKKMQAVLGMGRGTICPDDRVKIAHEVAAILREYPWSIRHADLEDHTELAKRITAVLRKKENKKPYHEISAYCYMLTQFPYYYRCKMVHANGALPLFNFGSDHELHCIKIANSLLEEFLDEYLPRWFNKDYFEANVLPIVKTEKQN